MYAWKSSSTSDLYSSIGRWQWDVDVPLAANARAMRAMTVSLVTMVVLICGWQVDVPVARDMVLRTDK